VPALRKILRKEKIGIASCSYVFLVEICNLVEGNMSASDSNVSVTSKILIDTTFVRPALSVALFATIITP